jgi:hypothetical protein
MRARLILTWLAVTGTTVTVWAQANGMKACGSTVHVLTDDATLARFPPAFQRMVEKTLAPLLAREAKVTDADQDGSNISDVKNALRLYPVVHTSNDKQIYAVWWDIPTICGAHENCPIWLIEADANRVTNLVRPSDPGNPAANAGTGWGVGVLPSNIPGERLITIDSSFVGGQGPAKAMPLCWRRQSDSYVADRCPSSCMDDLKPTGR